MSQRSGEGGVARFLGGYGVALAVVGIALFLIPRERPHRHVVPPRDRPSSSAHDASGAVSAALHEASDADSEAARTPVAGEASLVPDAEPVPEPYRPLLVRVLHHDGYPLSGVTVELVSATRRRSEQATDATGVASFPAALMRSMAPEVPLLVRMAEVECVCRAHGRTLEAADLDSEDPVTLFLPATGSVEVVATNAGPYTLPRAGASLYVDGGDPRIGFQAANVLSGGAPFVDGVATFPAVEVGTSLRLLALGTVTELAGPARAGDRVRVEIEFPPQLYFTAQLVSADGGAPLARHDVRIEWTTLVMSAEGLGVRQGTTDEHGRLVIPFHPASGPPLDGVEVEFHALAPDDPSRTLSARATIPAPIATRSELGTLAMREPDLIASGRVLDSRGQAVSDVLVQLQPVAARSILDTLGLPQDVTDGQGRFEVRGSPPTGPAQLVVEIEGYQRCTSPIVPPAHGVELILQQEAAAGD